MDILQGGILTDLTLEAGLLAYQGGGEPLELYAADKTYKTPGGPKKITGKSGKNLKHY